MCMIFVYVIYYDKFIVIDGVVVEMGFFNFSVVVVCCNSENVVLFIGCFDFVCSYFNYW